MNNKKKIILKIKYYINIIIYKIMDDLTEQFEEMKLDTQENKLLNQLGQFEKHLNDNKNNFIGDANEQFSNKVEKICAKLLKQFLIKEKIDKNPKVDEAKGKKSVYDFKYKQVYFDSKTSLEKKQYISTKQIYDRYFKKGEQLLEKYKLEKIPKNRLQLIDIVLNTLKIPEKEILKPKKSDKKKGSFDAQLISWKVLEKNIYPKKQPLYYIIVNIIKEGKKYQATEIKIVNVFSIDFSRYKMYLGNQFYYNKTDFMNTKLLLHKDINMEEIKKMRKKMLIGALNGQNNQLKNMNKTVSLIKNLIEGKEVEIEDDKEPDEYEKLYTEKDLEKLAEEYAEEQNIDLIEEIQDLELDREVIIEEYDVNAEKYNKLVDKYNKLFEDYKELEKKYEEELQPKDNGYDDCYYYKIMGRHDFAENEQGLCICNGCALESEFDCE